MVSQDLDFHSNNQKEGVVTSVGIHESCSVLMEKLFWSYVVLLIFISLMR
jgi:hypothetical protein